MIERKPKGALNDYEKKIVKGLLEKDWRNQDIQALVNIMRDATINSARVTEVKQDNSIKPASTKDLDFYIARKEAYDFQTGLNFYDHERIIRAREAMILAVQVFNSPSLKFKTEVFAMLANVAWTYLLHEYYHRKGVEIIEKDGRSLLLSEMVKKPDVPLSQGIKDNLNALKVIRDTVEHLLFRKSDLKWLSIFQACCLNFDQKLCDLFGEQTTLKNDLSFSLQFAKLDFDQLTQLQEYDIPEAIEAVDAKLEAEMDEQRLADMEYRFKVIYTFENSTKSKSHVKFLMPNEAEAKEFKHVLIKRELSDKNYPHKAGDVVKEIKKRTKKNFTQHLHTNAWKMFNARPGTHAKQPENTNRDYCIYNSTYKSYSYSNAWIDFIEEYIEDDQNFESLKAFRAS